MDWGDLEAHSLLKSMSERQIGAVLLAGGGEQYLQFLSVCICLSGPTAALKAVFLHKKEKRWADGQDTEFQQQRKDL